MPQRPPNGWRLATTCYRHRWRLLPYFLAILTAATVFFVATELFPYHSANHDEGVYLQQAHMLLDGQLTLTPPVEDAFRPWFFIEDGDSLYPKYAPVPAAIFAIGVTVGVPRLSLALVGATIAVLVYAIGHEVFDRHVGLVATLLLLTSPLFLLDTATFLPYAPTTALNLGFAYAYFRAERTATDPTDESSVDATQWASIAGAAIGIAFFSRPYTAVLFATPFIAHALWTLARERPTLPVRQLPTRLPGRRPERSDTPDRTLDPLLARRLRTASFGLVGVALTLTYNQVLTGHALVFPYQAFAPLDGLGFGHREILGHTLDYTPELALEVSVEVLSVYLADWAPMGVLGSILAGFGFIRARRDWSWRRAVLLGVAGTVVVGNAYFWGSYNILGNPDVTGDGLISILGPYYHFDLLVPTVLFAALGAVTVARGVRRHVKGIAPDRLVNPVLGVLLVLALVTGGVSTATALTDPVERNVGVTANYEAAYEPFDDERRTRDPAVVFLPEPYGPWLNHPFQALLNDPGYGGETVYALHENEFEVADTYPDRDYYRYAYRGTWNPFDGSVVEATLQEVQVVSGDTVTVTLTADIPEEASSSSLRLASGDEFAYFGAPVNGSQQQLTLRINDTSAWLTGPGVDSTGDGRLDVTGADEVTVELNVNTPGGGFSYHAVVPVSMDGTQRRAMTPRLEVCTAPQLCGGEAAHLPGDEGTPYDIDVVLSAET